MSREGLQPNELYNVEGVITHQIYQIGYWNVVPFEDLLSAGYLGYIRAQKAFKPEYKQMTLCYANKYIRTEIWKELKKEWKVINHSVTWKDDDEDPTYGGQYLDNIAAPDVSSPTDDIRVPQVAALLHRLNHEEAYIIRETYLVKNPRRLKDLAESMDCSKQRVSQIKLEGLRKLKVMLGEKS